MNNENNSQKHPSYGQIRIARRSSSNPEHLYGSDLSHKNTMVLSISLSELTRDLNCDRYFPYKDLIEIEMSSVQFSEAITNINTMGVPCTIRHFNGSKVDKCPYRDKNEIFKSEFDSTLHENNKMAKELLSTVKDKFAEKKSFNKTDKEEILSLINKLSMNLDENMSFMYKCCTEQIDKTVLEAKGEIEAYLTNKIVSLGLNALKEETTHLIQIEE